MNRRRTEIDWERIEVLYRANDLSVREIAKACGVTHTTINTRAKDHGWTRDLQARIDAKTRDLLDRKLSNGTFKIPLETEEQHIEAVAGVKADVLGTQREDIRCLRNIATRLMGEVNAQCADPGLLDELGDLVATAQAGSGSDSKSADRMLEAFRKATSTGARAKTVKDLADVLFKLIALEREAYNIQPVAPLQPANQPTAAPDRSQAIDYYRWLKNQPAAAPTAGTVH